MDSLSFNKSAFEIPARSKLQLLRRPEIRSIRAENEVWLLILWTSWMRQLADQHIELMCSLNDRFEGDTTPKMGNETAALHDKNAQVDRI